MYLDAKKGVQRELKLHSRYSNFIPLQLFWDLCLATPIMTMIVHMKLCLNKQILKQKTHQKKSWITGLSWEIKILLYLITSFNLFLWLKWLATPSPTTKKIIKLLYWFKHMSKHQLGEQQTSMGLGVVKSIRSDNFNILRPAYAY